ncbi:MAG: hypothetical protein H6Q55_3695, partial [Deltaproteobacteria bacterium]|nr:hypothetical protein [Deltaproteobacteria bacterium]
MISSDLPLEFDGCHCAVASKWHFIEVAQILRHLLRAKLKRRRIPERDQSLRGPVNVLFLNNDIEVTEDPERDISIDGGGESRAFVWNSGYPLLVKSPKEPPELLFHRQVA